MSRMIMNFEAVVTYAGTDDDGEHQYQIQLVVNHHVVYHWPITADLELQCRMYAGYLEREVARKLFELLNPINVKDVTP